MKNAWILLSVCLSTVLNSGCALALGQRRTCDPPELPIRPTAEYCLINTDGTASCYDPRHNPPKYRRLLKVGDIAVDSADQAAFDEWLYMVLKECKK